MAYGNAWGGDAWGNGSEEFTFDVSVQDSISMGLDSLTYAIPLRVDQAVALSQHSVRVTFSNTLDPLYAPHSSPANYTIPGLTVMSVVSVEGAEVVLNTTLQIPDNLYTVTAAQGLSLNGDTLGPDNTANFFGYVSVTTFLAGAESAIKVELVFTNAMLVNGDYTNPANYVIQSVTGTPIPVLSATPSGTSPIRRVTLNLGAALRSKDYYSVVLDPLIVDAIGNAVNPDTYIFQWVDKSATSSRPLEIPISNFSGEIVGGLLGEPDGLVFFSPALAAVAATSTLQVEEIDVCTKAYDEYHFPDPPDPEPLLTFRLGVRTVIGASSVLWAPADRLGLARMDSSMLQVDEVYPPIYNFVSGMLESPISDTPALAVLEEPIDITKAGFLNDVRWKTFPAGGATNFITANNLAPIGPGPSTSSKLSRMPRLDVRDLAEFLPVTDQVYVNTHDVELLTDSVSTPDLVETDAGIDEVALADTISITDSTSVVGAYNTILGDSVSITDSPVISQSASLLLSDTVSVTDTASTSLGYGVTTGADTISTTDTITRTADFGRSPTETPAVEDYVWTQEPVQYHDTTHSPLGLWQFSGGLTDSSGNGRTLTVESGTSRFTEIFPGVQGAFLDGSTTLIFNTADAALRLTGDMTIECLLQLSEYTTDRYVVSHGAAGETSADNVQYSINVLDNAGEFGYYQESGSGVDAGVQMATLRPPINQLCHLAVTRISQVVRVYLDGVLKATSATLTVPDGGSNGRFRIGSADNFAPICALASVKLIGSGLTTDQVKAEYNRTLGRFYGEI